MKFIVGVLFNFYLIIHQNSARAILKIYAAENPPLSIKKSDDSIGGIGWEILNEAIHEAKIEVTIEWLRAMEMVAKKPNTILFPIGINQITKQRFKIMGELYEDEVHIFTLKPNNPILNYNEISQLSTIGMIAGAPFIDFAIKYGFEGKLESSYNGERAVEKLKMDRINGLIITSMLGEYKLKRANVSKEIYQKGISLGKIHWAVATNKKSNTLEIKKLSDALNNFKKKDKYKNILSSYFK